MLFSRRFMAVTVLAVSTAQADTIDVDTDNCLGPGRGTVGGPYCCIHLANQGISGWCRVAIQGRVIP